MSASATAIAPELREHGILIDTAANNTLPFFPPLIITKKQLDIAISALASVALALVGRFVR